MSIPNYSSYTSLSNNPKQCIYDTKGNVPSTATRTNSLWTVAPNAGSAPSSPIVPTRLTAGALPLEAHSTPLYLSWVECSIGQSGALMIADRLSHQGGLSATTSSEQTTNLPTANLTRYTDGLGVMAGLEIYTSIGSTAANVTIRYTNHLGVEERISPSTIIGSGGHNSIYRFIIMPLAQGDLGVRSVQGVTLSNSTGSAGNFGVVLFKPLMLLPMVFLGSQQYRFDSILDLCGVIPRIHPEACLFSILFASTSMSGGHTAVIGVVEV